MVSFLPAIQVPSFGRWARYQKSNARHTHRAKASHGNNKETIDLKQGKENASKIVIKLIRVGANTESAVYCKPFFLSTGYTPSSPQRASLPTMLAQRDRGTEQERERD
jgi:hypothetical protein